jgi:hypothetical protein
MTEKRLMSSKTYVGITRLRFVYRTQDNGNTYHYFRRRPFPMVRLPGEPGSALFTTVYNAALQAKTHDEFLALRTNMQKQRLDNPELRSTLTEAIWAWVARRLTLAQAAIVARRFGVTIEHIVRNREIIDNPKN